MFTKRYFTTFINPIKCSKINDFYRKYLIVNTETEQRNPINITKQFPLFIKPYKFLPTNIPSSVSESDSTPELQDPLDIRSCMNLSNRAYYWPKQQGNANMPCLACAKCGSSFVRLGTLNNHLRDCVGPAERQRYPCYSCKKVYINKQNLSRHRRANCPGFQLAVCGICDSEFETQEAMMEHREQHFKDKRF